MSIKTPKKKPPGSPAPNKNTSHETGTPDVRLLAIHELATRDPGPPLSANHPAWTRAYCAVLGIKQERDQKSRSLDQALSRIARLEEKSREIESTARQVIAEVRSLRRRNEVLEAQDRVLGLVGALLFTSPPDGQRGACVDDVWSLEKLLDNKE